MLCYQKYVYDTNIVYTHTKNIFCENHRAVKYFLRIFLWRKELGIFQCKEGRALER